MSLARPWVNILDHSMSRAPFLTEEVVKYSSQLFAKPIVKHPVTGAFNVNKQSLARVPAIAIVGESNVGKSSLLNKLLFLKEPAKPVKLSSDQIEYSPVSSKPGRTRHVFRFDLSNKLRICDLPGYGYAEAPKHIAESWNSLIDNFLDKADIRRAIVLVDAGKSVSDLDYGVMEMLQSRRIPVQVVLTKIDTVRPAQLHAVMIDTIDRLKQLDRKYLFPYIHAVSSLKHFGMLEFRCALGAIARDVHNSY
jgi:GTP-binding protein